MSEESRSRSERKGNPLLILFLLFPEGSALRTQEKRGKKKGDRSTNSGGGDNGKFEKPDLHKNSHSSLVGCPLGTFTLRHQEAEKRRWCEHLEIQPYPHGTNYKQGAIFTDPAPGSAPWAGCHSPFNRGCSPGTLGAYSKAGGMHLLAYNDKHQGSSTLRL